MAAAKAPAKILGEEMEKRASDLVQLIRYVEVCIYPEIFQFYATRVL